MYVMGIWKNANFWNQSSVGNREDILEHHLSPGCPSGISARWFDVHSFSDTDCYRYCVVD